MQDCKKDIEKTMDMCNNKGKELHKYCTMFHWRKEDEIQIL